MNNVFEIIPPRTSKERRVIIEYRLRFIRITYNSKKYRFKRILSMDSNWNSFSVLIPTGKYQQRSIIKYDRIIRYDKDTCIIIWNKLDFCI